MLQKAGFLIGLLTLSGCASTPAPCPSVEQEKVSMCRARAECMPSWGQRFAAGYAGQQHIQAANFQMCVGNNIEAQKANAALSLIEKSTQTASD